MMGEVFYIEGGNYQTIIRDGVVIQHGAIDTWQKYQQLIGRPGIDLLGKNVLDVGCNTGEMCRFAKQGGAAYVLGIDKNPDYIASARRLNPELHFNVQTLANATGTNWGLVICSAMLHYVPNLGDAMSDLARLSDHVVGDIPIDTERSNREAMFTISPRGLLIPNWPMFLRLAETAFTSVRMLGSAASPDSSYRALFELRGRRPQVFKAVIIYGKGGVGKTTMARDLVAGEGFRHFQTDSIFLDWRQEVEPGSLSNMDFLDILHRQDQTEYNRVTLAEYMHFHRRKLKQWIAANQGLPIVIEGYDLFFEPYRQMVNVLLCEFGYGSPKEIELLPFGRSK